MRASKLFGLTIREDPADAEVMSHKLLVRSAGIRKLSSGIYSYLPLFTRTIKKIENIVRDELNKAGCQELLMPVVQPSDIWIESGRWNLYGKELARFQDRHERFNILAPTHEEVITILARSEINSYKQLPVNLYQIQVKFRDEVRPRFGLLRGREFIMKDAYSFHASQECLEAEYDNMAQAYTNIFKRCGLETRMVESDSGSIGGAVSHEFMVLTEQDCGESYIVYCNQCGYSANLELASSILPETNLASPYDRLEIMDTPNASTIEKVSSFLQVPAVVTCKSMVYMADNKPALVLIRGDLNINETKLGKVLHAQELRLATDEEIENMMAQEGYHNIKGYIGPIGINTIRKIFDNSLQDLHGFVIGANKYGKHTVGVKWERDLPTPPFVDIRETRMNDYCPKCHARLTITQGIEVGNIFQLGTKYSQAMNARFLDQNGKEYPFIMGCYGIGITRTAAAAIEQFHDQDGIVWPPEIAPYNIVVIPVNIQNQEQWHAAEKIYKNLLNKGMDVVLDDRDERAGVKFKDADLIGYPIRITVGKTVSEGTVEIKQRHSQDKTFCAIDQVVDTVVSIFKNSLCNIV